jgi:hypothetical protein
VICVDSDVFLIDLRYPRDRRAHQNRAFLNWVGRSGDGATTVFNLLEVAGLLSFNLNEQQLVDFYVHFPKRYGVRVLPYQDPRQRLPGLRLSDILRVMQKRAAFGDALIAATVNRLYSGLEAFITWNDEHFRGRLAVPVFTPGTFPQV